MYKAVALLAALLLASCCHAQRGIDVISAARSRGLNTFVAAVEAAGLTALLQNTRIDLTVFAPTDAAFASAHQVLGYSSVADLAARNPTLLAALVQNHIITGRDLDSDDLVRASPMATLASGQTLSATRVARRTYTLTSLGGAIATITSADIEAGEAELHIIDAVLLPDTSRLSATAPPPPPPGSIISGSKVMSVYAALTTDPSLSSFAAAVQAAGLTAMLQNMRTDMTVFAPTNAAFTSALSALGYVSVADLATRDPALLAAVVKNHVVSGRDLDSDDLVRASPIVTLALGQTLRAVRNANTFTLTSLGGATATITATDIDAGEAELHIIDAVLLPGTSTPSSTTAASPPPPRSYNYGSKATSVYAALTTDPTLSSFAQAVQAAGLMNTLWNTRTDMTVFAPTNAAFTSTLSALGYASVADLAARDSALLRAMVQNHVILGRDLDADDLVRASPMATLAPRQTLSAARNGLGYTLTSLGGVTATITVQDIDAGEAELHIIDAVLLPSTNGL